MHRRKVIIATVLTASYLSTSCTGRGDAETNPLSRYGWRATTTDRETLAAAIEIANRILQDDVGFRLTPGWEPRDGEPGTVAVPVYLLGPRNLARTDRVFVPSDERFVVVNALSTKAYLSELAGDGNREEMLAVMLLHELGHIVHGHAGSFGPEEEISLKLLNADTTPQKNRELAADRFAATQIRLAMRPGQPVPRFSSALKAALALSGSSFRASTRLQLEFFGDVSGRRYLDRGYSHPNLALRLLIILHEVSPDDMSRQFLEDFLREREPRPPAVLYREPPESPALETDLAQ